MFYDAWKFIGSLVCTRDETKIIGKFHVDRLICKAGGDAYIRALICHSERMYRLLMDVKNANEPGVSTYGLSLDDYKRRLMEEVDRVVREIASIKRG